MSYFEIIPVIPGVTWVSVPEAGLNMLCGCPEDSIKHLIRLGLIKTLKKNDVTYETGPNAILLSEVSVMHGSFANLAEFPVLQMLYKQGMILPNHPNNNGQKPILIGTAKQLKSQLDYIYCGNYGLTELQEFTAAGVSEAEAKEILRMKLKFAFGNFTPSADFLQTIEIQRTPTPIKGGVAINRIDLNRYEISFRDEMIEVDLNLPAARLRPPPYQLSFQQIKTGYFSIIHSGEGDGWDTNRPCMSSILAFDGRLYLIDAGPNILNTLNVLGISITSLSGVFMTHCHDDHFCGLTALIRSDHRLEFYAAPLVRASVSKKLSALLGTSGDIIAELFKIHELMMNDWNEVGNLQIKPLLSPHPVETTNLLFRAASPASPDGFESYYHLADITSARVLKTLVTENTTEPGISSQLFHQTLANYSIPAVLKKVDIGGGLIHGDAVDFRGDQSGKIVFSHIARELTDEEREIGNQVPFGLVETLIASHLNQDIEAAARYLQSYFDLESQHLRDLLNADIQVFAPGTTILRAGSKSPWVYLTVTGTVDMLDSKRSIHQQIAAGSLIGGTQALTDDVMSETYVSTGYVTALQMPARLFLHFVRKHKLENRAIRMARNHAMLCTSELFNGIAYSPPVTAISLDMMTKSVSQGAIVTAAREPRLVLILDGEFSLFSRKKLIYRLGKGEVLTPETILGIDQEFEYSAQATKNGTLAIIPGRFVKDIPLLRWRLMEICGKNRELALSLD
jgi:hemerythrin